MKKILMSIFACILVFSCGTVFATEVQSNSGEEVYLEDYSQYEDVLNDMDYQAEYKKMYEEMITSYIDEQEKATRVNLNKAKILEASDVKVEYGQSYYNGNLYKSSYQTLKIEILDGEYKGEKIEDVQYILTCDIFENLKLAKVREGQTINVYVTKAEDGSLYAGTTTYDSPVQRFPVLLTLIIIALVIIVIYTGKHIAKFLIPLVLIVDLLFVVIAPSILNSVNILFLVGVLVILSSILISVLKFGVKAESFAVILSCIVLTVVLTVALYGFDSLANMTGITYDSAYIMESILPRNVDGELMPKLNFHDLSVGITALLMFFGIIYVACKTVEMYKSKEKNNEIVKNVTLGMRAPLAESLVLVVSVLLVTLIPKLMLFMVNKSSMLEIMNSEVLITEIARISFILIGMAVTVPVTAMLTRLMDEEI